MSYSEKQKQNKNKKVKESKVLRISKVPFCGGDPVVFYQIFHSQLFANFQNQISIPPPNTPPPGSDAYESLTVLCVLRKSNLILTAKLQITILKCRIQDIYHQFTCF
jgi:hypothetical protein